MVPRNLPSGCSANSWAEPAGHLGYACLLVYLALGTHGRWKRNKVWKAWKQKAVCGKFLQSPNVEICKPSIWFLWMPTQNRSSLWKILYTCTWSMSNLRPAGHKNEAMPSFEEGMRFLFSISRSNSPCRVVAGWRKHYFKLKSISLNGEGCFASFAGTVFKVLNWIVFFEHF